MNWLEQHEVFLAYDNLSNPPETQKQAFNKTAFAYSLVRRFARHPERNGGGLELDGGLWYQNGIQNLAAIVNRIKPNRLVMFGSEAAAINYQRMGANPTNQAIADWLEPGNKLEVEIAKTNQLLKLIGYQ
jgi:hypothetical protein